MVTRYKDVTGTPIMLGDLVEVNTATQGYIGEVVFEKNFGQIAVRITHRRTCKHPERWEAASPVHDTYTYLNSYQHKILGLFPSRRIRPVEIIKRDTRSRRRGYQ